MHPKLHLHAARRLFKRADPPALDVDVLDDSLDKRADDVATVFSVVYVTASATFSGPTAGFVTLGADLTTTSKAPKTTATRDDDDDDDDDRTTATKAKQTSAASKSSSTASTHSSKVTSTISPTAKTSSTHPSSSSSSLVTSSSVVITSSAAASSTIASSVAKTQATSSSSASSSAVADASSGGMSTGAKAGVALVVVCMIGVAAGLAYFFIRKKKAQNKAAIGMEPLDDEKKGFVSKSPSTTTIPQPPQTHIIDPEPPRVSYRPGSQFSASVLGDAEKTAAGLAAGNRDPANPFGIHAQTVDAHSRDVISPIPEERPLSPPVELQGSPVPSPTAGSFNISSPPTPSAEVKAEVGMASAVPMSILATVPSGAVPADPPGSTVHRVQLEFKPSMDDELELKVGQIVRVLHEYDDGWALCIRMDRSQQGVAPRTCLSKLPLKPRPMGPPPGAQNGPPRAQNSPPRGPPRPGQGPNGLSRPGPAPRARQPPIAPQPSATPQPRRPSIQPSKQSSPTLAEQVQSRQRSMSVSSSPTKAPKQSQQRVASPTEAHRRSLSMGSTTSANKFVNGFGAPVPLGVPTRKPVPGQAL